MRKLILFGVAALAAAAAVAVLAQKPPQPASPQPGQKPERRLEVRVTPEMLRHSRLQDVLYFVDFVYGAAILVLVLATRISGRLREAASRAVRWPFVVAMLYFVLLSLVMTALAFCPRTCVTWSWMARGPYPTALRRPIAMRGW